MKRTILLFCGLLAQNLFAQPSFQTLNEIKYDANSVTFKLSGPSKFNAFKITNPLRLVIDFTDVEHNLKTKEITVADNKIFSKIRSGQFQNEPIKIARAVIELKSDVAYEVKSKNSDVTVTFITQTTAPAAVPSKNESVTTSEKPSSQVDTSTAPKPVEVVAVPIEEEPQKKVEKKEEPEKVVKPAPSKEQPKPGASTAVKKKEPKPKRVILPKTPVSFDFHEADIRDVLRVLSAQSGINIIYGPDVTGTLTITLRNVPFDEAFNTILTLKNLVSQEVGSNILRVLTPATLSTERAQAVTFTKTFPLNYAKAEDVKTQLDAIRGAEGRRGIITVDARTNTLIITDTPEGLDSAAKLIAEIDRKPWQVLIEAKLVEVSLSDKIDLGIDWAFAQTLRKDSTITTIGRTRVEPLDTQGVGVGGTNIRTPVGPVGGGTGVTFPASPVGGQLAGISFGIITDSARFAAMLSALATKGKTKLLSNPRVTTLNNQEAKILVGQRVPYVQQTTQLGTGAGGVTSEIQFLEVGIKLTVTPTINADRQITLKVYPQVSLLVRMDPAGPVVGTREAETTVMVKDNETLVIGGLIREEDIKNVTQVPLLGDIPILGAFFKRNLKTKERTELLVFITPKIIDN